MGTEKKTPSQGTIIVVNGLKTNTRVECRILERENYWVIKAHSGFECLDKLKELKANNQPIDFILGSVDISDMSGFELCSNVKVLDKNILFVLIAKTVTTELYKKAITSKADDFWCRNDMFITRVEHFVELSKTRRKLAVAKRKMRKLKKRSHKRVSHGNITLDHENFAIAVLDERAGPSCPSHSPR